MRQLLDRFENRIGPTTVAFVKSTNDDHLWCAHTMRFSSSLRATKDENRICVQQKTKISWCVPGIMPGTHHAIHHCCKRYSTVQMAHILGGCLSYSRPADQRHSPHILNTNLWCFYSKIDEESPEFGSVEPI